MIKIITTIDMAAEKDADVVKIETIPSRDDLAEEVFTNIMSGLVEQDRMQVEEHMAAAMLVAALEDAIENPEQAMAKMRAKGRQKLASAMQESIDRQARWN